MTTQLFIPSIGTKIRLEAPWIFELYNEHRNTKFRDAYFAYIGSEPKLTGSYATNACVLYPRTELVIDRIYIRKGLGSFDSVTFRILPLREAPALKGRFWVKLKDVNKILCEVIE